MRDTRLLAMSLVSLGYSISRLSAKEMNHDELDNVKSCEKNELGLVIKTHAFNMRFQNFEDLFTILMKKVMSAASGRNHRRTTNLGSSLSEEFSNDSTSVFCVHHLSKDFLAAAIG